MTMSEVDRRLWIDLAGLSNLRAMTKFEAEEAEKERRKRREEKEMNDIDDGLKNYVKTSVECVKGAYDTGYKNGKNVKVQDARQKGREEAWELAKKIFLIEEMGGLPGNELIDIFGKMDPCDIVTKYSASTALKMFKEYYRKKEKEKEKSDIESFDDLVKAYGADKVKNWFELYKG